MTKSFDSKTSLPIIAVTMGDPCGIGPEVIVKGLGEPSLHDVCHPFVIGDLAVIRADVARFTPKMRVVPIQSVSEAVFQYGRLHVLEPITHQIENNAARFMPGVMNVAASTAALKAIEMAAKLALALEIDGIATAPIHKEGMKGAGFAFPGHTEFFAEAAHTEHFGMMMIGGGMKIMLASIHLPLREAISQLNTQDLLKTLLLTDAALKRDFGQPHPHIAVAGLNPHAGERGILGQEEKSIIAPAIELALREGLNVSGPYPADTLFYQLRQGRFDAAVALYHDQALIPIKLLAFGSAVNITAGLPFIRTSVDHGTAFDIAGRAQADPGSLQEAVRWAAKMAGHRYPRLRRPNTQ